MPTDAPSAVTVVTRSDHPDPRLRSARWARPLEEVGGALERAVRGLGQGWQIRTVDPERAVVEASRSVFVDARALSARLLRVGELTELELTLEADGATERGEGLARTAARVVQAVSAELRHPALDVSR